MTLTEAEIDERAIALMQAQGYTRDWMDRTPGSKDREYIEATLAWERTKATVVLDDALAGVKREVTASLGPTLAAIVWRLFVWQAWMERRRDDLHVWRKRRRFRRIRRNLER